MAALRRLSLLVPVLALTGTLVAVPTPAWAADPVAAEADALWAERPAGATTLTEVAVDASGRPVVTAIEQVDTLREVRAAVADAPTELTWAVPRRVVGTDPFLGQQWGLTNIAAPTAWTVADGTGITVAVVDTGVAAHADLGANIAAGYDFVDNDTTPTDGHGHGTHVTGILAATAGNDIGIAGAAPGVTILPVRVLNDAGAGYDADVAAGIVWAVDNGANVINLSLGGGYSSAEQSAIDYAIAHDVVVVAAAGNDGPTGAPSWPAADSRVLAVAATTSANLPASYSTRGTYVDVAAPGSSILSTYLGGTYQYLSGTSMATPFAAATAAAVRQVHPSWTEAQVRSAIIGSAIDVTPTGVDTATGAGRISMTGAISQQMNWQGPAPATVTATVRATDLVVTTSAVSDPQLAGYRFERDGVVLASRSTTRTYTDNDLALTAGTYTYTVRAVSSAGALGAPTSTTITVTPPSAPTILNASSTGTTVTMAPTGAPGVTTWYVYRNGALVTGVASSSSIVLGSQPLGTHTYTVRASGSAGTSAMSDPVTVTVELLAPANVTATVSTTNVLVTATAVPGAARYRFDRDGVTVATLTTPRFTDTNRALTAGTSIYTVAAIGSAGQVGPSTSASLTVTPPATPSVTASLTGTTVSLAMTGAGASQWLVYRNGTYIGAYPGTSSLVKLSSQPLGTHTYSVRAVTSSGASALSTAVTVTIQLVAPANVTATVSTTNVLVTATAVPGAARYRFDRDGVTVATLTTPRFTDTNRALTAGTSIYTVAAIGSAGQVGPSTSASLTVTPPATPSVTAVAAGNAVTLTVAGTGATHWLAYRDGTYVGAFSATSSTVKLSGQPLGARSYTVRAVSPTGASALSNAATVTLILPATTSLRVAVNGTSLTVTAARVTGAALYRFERDGVVVATTSATAWTDTDRALTAGTSTYTVTPLETSGTAGVAKTVSFTVVPPTTPMIASGTVAGTTVTLTLGSTASRWLVYRDGSLVTTITTTSKTLTLLNNPSGTHTYTVRAASLAGVSALSNALSISV